MTDTQRDSPPGPLRAKPVAPERPLPSDCCDSGCDRCVHDIYAEELVHYEQRLAAWEAATGDTAFTTTQVPDTPPRLADDPSDPIKGA
jgi:hypothetical protein